jgi:hypothetical protein
MGFRGLVARNTLAHAHEVGDGRIYRDSAQALMVARATSIATNRVKLSETVYRLDTTTIDLCRSLFP